MCKKKKEFHFQRPQSAHLCASVLSQASQHCSSPIMALAFAALSSPHLIYFKSSASLTTAVY